MVEGISMALLVILVVYYIGLFIWHKYKNSTEEVVDEVIPIVEEVVPIEEVKEKPKLVPEKSRYQIENERRRTEEYFQRCQFVADRRAEGFTMKDPVRNKPYDSNDELIIRVPSGYRGPVPRPAPNPMANTRGGVPVSIGRDMVRNDNRLYRGTNPTSNSSSRSGSYAVQRFSEIPTSYVDDSITYNNFSSSEHHDHHHHDSDDSGSCGSSDCGSGGDGGCDSD